MRASELADLLGISKRTVRGWCQADPKLALKKDGIYWIRLVELAKRPGFDVISAFTIPSARWMKAVHLASILNCPRRTVSGWCSNRRRFAKRIGRTWYVDLESLGATDEQIEVLRTWSPSELPSKRVRDVLKRVVVPASWEGE